jgi:Ser/Thr protein kinase RdoA (MazF antagonist)
LVESCYTPAALKVLKSFPVDEEDVELIAHSENVTFRVSVRGSDTDCVLRLHRPGYNSIEELDSERAWTRAETDLLLRARERVRAELSAYGERPDNFSLIHADLHPDNIVRNGEDLSLIDFDDSAYGWHMYDIASALIEDRLAPGFGTLREALLEGYREHRPLAMRDVEMLPAFLLIRGMALIGWFHQRPEHVGSDFFEKVKNWVIAECESERI